MKTHLTYLIFICLCSCTTQNNPLQDAEYPCIVIEKGFNYAIKIQCKDTIYYFTDKKYYETLNEGDTIKAQ